MFWVNALGWERGGARLLFLAPVAPDRVLAAKNLALAGYATLLFALAATAHAVTAGPPPGWAALGATLLVIGLAPALYGLGNVVSIVLPRAAPVGIQRAGALSPLAALAGMGIASLAALARERVAWRERVTWRALALAAVLATAALDQLIVQRSAEFAPWLVPVISVGAVAGVLAVTGAFAPRAATAVAIATFFAAPLAWAGTTLVAFDAGLPYAGPELIARASVPRPPAPSGAPQPASRSFEFLVAERRGERWLAATSSEMTAASMMLRADVAVMALGGFSGGDPILTPRSLEAIVRRGELRFVLVEDRMRADLREWVQRTCVEVPPARYGGPPPLVRPGQPFSGLFDCAAVRRVP
jgi:hypothetical protein